MLKPTYRPTIGMSECVILKTKRIDLLKLSVIYKLARGMLFEFVFDEMLQDLLHELWIH